MRVPTAAAELAIGFGLLAADRWVYDGPHPQTLGRRQGGRTSSSRASGAEQFIRSLLAELRLDSLPHAGDLQPNDVVIGAIEQVGGQKLLRLFQPLLLPRPYARQLATLTSRATV